MGYNTHVSGSIRIEPPIPWGQIKDSPFLPTKLGGDPEKEVVLVVREESVETDEGTLVRRYADEIAPCMEDRFKAYSIVEHLQELVDAHGKGRSFAGRLDGEGEESSDLWRLYVRDGRVDKDVPRIVWPDGEIVQGRA